ncbi:MAG: hypothetical protein WDO74_31545 [Pseudomonadota bacterium]
MSDTERLNDNIPGEVRELCARLREGGFRSVDRRWLRAGTSCLHSRATSPRQTSEAIGTSPPRARPEQVQKLFRRVIPTGIQHGTVTVMMKHSGYEVTTLRGETEYSDGRRPDSVYFVDDIKDDPRPA